MRSDENAGQHEVAKDAASKDALADQAFEALKQALAADPGLRGLARGLLYEEVPEHLPGDNDLATLRDDKRFQDLVGLP